MTSLTVRPCRQQCCWRPASERAGGLPLFRCRGCGSEWVRSQVWAPVDADGTRHPGVAAELARRS